MSAGKPSDPGQERKRRGAWYTPMPLVEAILAEALFSGARSILDPACGDGRFLAASGLPDQLGVDIADVAVPPPARLVRADALDRPWDGERFDVVVGNPPFLSQRRTLTRRSGAARFGAGPLADTATEFLAVAIEACRRGGRVGLVLPQSILAARDAAAVRRFVGERAALSWMWWSDEAVFDAEVRVWAAVWEVGGRQGPVRRCSGLEFAPRPAVTMPEQWAGLLRDEPPPPAGGPTLGELATFTVGYRDQYYGLAGAVGDDADGPPLITSGLIDRNTNAWGSRAVRFMHHRYRAPRVDLGRIDPRLRGWAERQLRPKLLVANQTAQIEAVHDPSGAWLPSVPVISCFTEQPEHVLTVLHSAEATRWVRYHAAGSGMSPAVVRLSPSLLASIPA